MTHVPRNSEAAKMAERHVTLYSKKGRLDYDLGPS